MLRVKGWFHFLRNAPKDSALYQAWGDRLPPKYPVKGIRYDTTPGGIVYPTTPVDPGQQYRALPFNGLRRMGDWTYYCVTGQWKAIPGVWGWNLGLVVAWGRVPDDWFEHT